MKTPSRLIAAFALAMMARGHEERGMAVHPLMMAMMAQGGQERLIAVGCAQRVQLGQLRSQPGVAGRGGTGDERLRDQPERTELFLGNGFRSHRPPRSGPGAVASPSASASRTASTTTGSSSLKATARSRACSTTRA